MVDIIARRKARRVPSTLHQLYYLHFVHSTNVLSGVIRETFAIISVDKIELAHSRW